MTAVNPIMENEAACDRSTGIRIARFIGENAVVPEHKLYVILKHTVEWLIALTLVVITAPIIFMLALLVKLRSPGPAFYAQTRLGRYGQRYRILKLRTMVHNAEGATGPVWAASNDQRVTPIGKFLREMHLDELPQLFNVLRGEMTLIGPRPERPEIAGAIQQNIPHFDQRLQLKPGVTGLAQMLVPADDPNDVHFVGLRRKLAHDLYYVRHVNMMLDLRIALSTTCYFASEATLALRHLAMRPYARKIHRAIIEEQASACMATGEMGQPEIRAFDPDEADRRLHHAHKWARFEEAAR